MQRQLSTEHGSSVSGGIGGADALHERNLDGTYFQGSSDAVKSKGPRPLDSSESTLSLSNFSLSVWEDMGKTHRSYRHSARVHMQNSVLDFLQSPVVSTRNLGRAMELRCCRARSRIWGTRALGKVVTELGGKQAATFVETVLLRLTCKGVGPSSGELGRNKSLYDPEMSVDITKRCKAMADFSSNTHVPANIIKTNTNSFWQSRSGKKQIKIYTPDDVVVTSINLYTCNRSSYSPKDIAIKVKIRGESQKRTVKVVRSLALSAQWNELVSLQEMEIFMEETFGEHYESFVIEHIELDVLQNHQGAFLECHLSLKYVTPLT